MKVMAMDSYDKVRRRLNTDSGRATCGLASSDPPGAADIPAPPSVRCGHNGPGRGARQHETVLEVSAAQESATRLVFGRPLLRAWAW